MQSGKIKYWNEQKGYGFIDADQQDEDVFFHISTARLPAPISIGQSVYFNSERNNKNQLRATEVSSIALNLQQSPVASTPASVSQPSLNPKNASGLKRQNLRSNKNSHRANANKKSSLSTLFSLIALIAVAVYLFADIKSSFFADELQTSSAWQDTVSTTKAASTKTITGDAQIDHTIELIQQGGPYPYPHKDGSPFYNREGRLPTKPRGYYREYTVPTPRVSHRGARRIVTGGKPPEVYYLTVDHYNSFRQLQVN